MNDNREHLQALMDAYTAATGRKLTLSPERRKTLREFDRREFTAADVKAVLDVLGSRVRRGVSGYSEASLDWKNSMQDVDRFEDRLATIRTARARKAGARREQAEAAPRAETLPVPGGGTVSRIEAPRAAVPEVPRVGPSLTEAVLAKIAEGKG